MQLLKVKTARFAEVVAKCGAPEVVTLWVDPKKDKNFQRAVAEQRIMSVHQTIIGGKKDFGEIGFTRGANVAYLRFPKSVRRYAGRRIVGIDYGRLSEPQRVGPAVPVARERTLEKRTAFVAHERRQGAAPVDDSSRRLPHSKRKKPAQRPSRSAEAQSEARAAEIQRKPAPPALDPCMAAAVKEARKGLKQGGIPIGAALARDGKLLSVGHNQRVQKNDPVAHAETDCLRKAGRIGSYRGCTLYSTLMPCFFCAGAAVQFGIKKIVVGEKRNFAGAEEFLREQGIEVIDLDLAECREMMGRFIRDHPKLWHEDIGK